MVTSAPSWCELSLRATSHTRLRACDRYTSRTLTGGKGRYQLQVRFTLRLRDQRSTWMQDGCNICMDTYMASNGSCVHGHLDYFQKPPLGGRPNTIPRNYGTPNAHNCSFIIFYHVWGPTWIKFPWTTFNWGPGHMWLHTTLEDPWPHYMIVEVSWDNLWTLSFGLSQSHGHGSWPMSEMALSIIMWGKAQAVPVTI